MIKQWSYSRFTCYDKCPAQANYRFVMKLPTPSSPAAERGIMIHKKAEHVVKGDIQGIPKELEKFKQELLYVKMLYKKGIVFTERDLAVTKNWNPTTYDDWDGVWCRGNSDLVVIEGPVATDVDYKTGKKYDSHAEQGELYATQTFSHFPTVKDVDVEFWYVDSGEVDGDNYSRKDLKKLRKKWEKKVIKMLNDKEFKPSPGNHCKWCHFAASKGGPCAEA